MTNDADNRQNLPVLTQAIAFGGATRVTGTLNSLADTTFTVDVYSNPACDATGYGEGRTLLGSAAVTTVGNDGAFSFDVTGGAVGASTTATDTNPSNQTSEFSLCRTAAGAGTIKNDDAAPVSTPDDSGGGRSSGKNKDSDAQKPPSQLQQQQQQHTNQSNLDQYHTEGNIAAIERSADGAALLITLALGRGETLVVEYRGSPPDCPEPRVGDYLTADGEQGGREEQGRFIAEQIEVSRRR
ncbi:MAG: hypothetical protein IT306_20035 [Chloroflexi bacterium]|nr:hypothetical protein [Chloroflexota bacterium]